MKVLYVVPSSFDDLKKKGVIDLIKQRDEGGFFEKVITLHPFTKKNRTICIDDKFQIIEYGWQTGFKFIDKLPLTKLIGTLFVLFKILFVFPIFIKKEKVNVIRATDPYYAGLIGLYYSKIFKIPLLVSIHSDYDKRYLLDGKRGSFTILGSRKLAKILEKYIYKKATLILPIREYIKSKIIKEFKIQPNKISVYPHGIDFNVFDNIKYIDIKKRFSIPKNRKILSFVGRLSKENYVYDLINIAKTLNIKRKDFILLIVGDGEERKNLEDLVKKYQLDNFVLFTGFQNKEIVFNIRKQSFVSLCLMGGFSLIEACAAERPVIAYNVEWHYELVKDGKTGFLVEEGNVEKVVEKIEFLFENPEIADKMGKDARKLAYEKHNLENVIKLKQNIIKKVLINSSNL